MADELVTKVTSMSKSLKPHCKMGVRVRTHAKFLAIARAKRWSIAEAADAVADHFIQREGIRVGRRATPMSSAVSGDESGGGSEALAKAG